MMNITWCSRMDRGFYIQISEGATLVAAVRHGIRQGKLYRLLGKPVDGSREILDAISVSEIEGKQNTPEVEVVPSIQSSLQGRWA